MWQMINETNRIDIRMRSKSHEMPFQTHYCVMMFEEDGDDDGDDGSNKRTIHECIFIHRKINSEC